MELSVEACAQWRGTAGERSGKERPAPWQMHRSSAAVRADAAGAPKPCRPGKCKDRLIPRVVPETEEQEGEHRGAEVREPRSQPGHMRQAKTRNDDHPGSQRDVQVRPRRACGHPIGTLTVRLYSSNSDTRSVICISHVPPGLSTAELSM